MTDGRLPWEDQSPASEGEDGAPAADIESPQSPVKSDNDPTTTRRGSSPVASNGKRINSDDYPESPLAIPDRYAAQVYYRLEAELPDYEELSAINRDINRARAALNATQSSLAKAQREAVVAEVAYRRATSRVMIGLSGGTEKSRAAVVDIETENEYGNMLVKRAVADEVMNLVRSINRDIDALTVIANNLRAQINLA